MKAQLARDILAIKTAAEPRPWEYLPEGDGIGSGGARPKQLPPDHPRHHLPDKSGFRCGCDAPSADWTTWLYMAGRGAGKRLDVKTPVVTPEGWKLLGDLRPGDYVFDHAGKPTRVLAVYDGMPSVAYRLTFSDGSVLDADADHLWTTWTHLDRKQYLCAGIRSFPENWPAWRSPSGRGPKVRTTKEIAETTGHGIRSDTNHCIPVCAPLQFPEASLPIDPYVLGVWSGDGSSAEASVTISDTDAQEMLEYLASAGTPQTGVLRRKPGAKCATYPIGRKSPARDPANGRMLPNGSLTSLLRALGVWKNKHIPESYLYASAEQRLALLRGLMDTDGGWSGSSIVEFSSTNYHLASATLELARGLGQKARIHEGRATLYGRDCGPRWRVTWTPTINVFRLRRKACRFREDAAYGKDGRPQGLRNHHRMIKSAEQIDPKPMRCITVESEHGLFLAGEAMIPTHNTRAGAEWTLSVALSEPGIYVGVCAPTFAGVRDVCFENLKSGLIHVARKGEIVDYNRNNMQLRLRNGSIIQGYSAQNPDSIRGANLSYAWFDELAQIQYVRFYDYGLKPALRIRPKFNEPRLMITTTPKRSKLIRMLIAQAERNPDKVHYTRSTSRENPYFARGALADLEMEFAGTYLERQELLGEYVEEADGALFLIEDFCEHRIFAGEEPDFRRIVVAVDPATSTAERADETGIVVAAEGINHHYYTLEDCSMKGTVEQVMSMVASAFRRWNASVVVAEQQGVKDYMRFALEAIDPGIPLRLIPAMKGKLLRAQPISILNSQGRVHMVGEFEELEKQLTAMTAESDRSQMHDDHADAWVYAMSELSRGFGGSYMEVYGFYPCLKCGEDTHQGEEKCRHCGTPVGKKEKERVRDRSTRWATAYMKTCVNEHVYPIHMAKCPQCNPSPESYIRAAMGLGKAKDWLAGRKF